MYKMQSLHKGFPGEQAVQLTSAHSLSEPVLIEKK